MIYPSYPEENKKCPAEEKMTILQSDTIKRRV
jgi:hypothetical protein